MGHRQDPPDPGNHRGIPLPRQNKIEHEMYQLHTREQMQKSAQYPEQSVVTSIWTHTIWKTTSTVSQKSAYAPETNI